MYYNEYVEICKYNRPDGTDISMKRSLKMIISILYWAVFRIRCSIRSAMGLSIPGTCTVLYYHAVTSGQRNRFARQMDTILRLAKPVPADHREPLESGVHHAAVTFDDGYQSVVDNALPEMVKRKIPLTIFIPAAYLGEHPQWEVSPEIAEEVIITTAQLRSLSSDLVTIGSHSATHKDITLLEAEKAEEEICGSRTQLESIVERDVELFSFPYGKYNQELVELSQRAGYERVFSTLPKLAMSGENEYVTGRVSTDPNDRPFVFKLKLLGAYSWLHVAIAWKRKLQSGARKILGRNGIYDVDKIGMKTK